jgi:UDP-N-acetylmuramate--alanine ligase
VLLKSLDDLPQALADLARDGDVVLTMGAGSIGAAAHELPGALAVIVAGGSGT